MVDVFMSRVLVDSFSIIAVGASSGTLNWANVSVDLWTGWGAVAGT